jgi:hypothetical protein
MGSAHAAVSESSPTGFLVTVTKEVHGSSRQIYEALARVDRWWRPSHTWSGSAANLSLSSQAGGCFCEAWSNNSVQHAVVVYAAQDQVLRLRGALGPLQALAVDGVLTFSISEKDGKTILLVTYRVSGNEAAGLPKLAGPVDGVISEQVLRLVRYVESGSAD